MFNKSKASLPVKWRVSFRIAIIWLLEIKLLFPIFSVKLPLRFLAAIVKPPGNYPPPHYPKKKHIILPPAVGTFWANLNPAVAVPAIIKPLVALPLGFEGTGKVGLPHVHGLLE